MNRTLGTAFYWFWFSFTDSFGKVDLRCDEA